MADNIEIIRFIRGLKDASDKLRYEFKITNQVRDGEDIIIFRSDAGALALKYEKINHLSNEEILKWVSQSIEVAPVKQYLREILDEYERNQENKEKKSKFDIVK